MLNSRKRSILAVLLVFAFSFMAVSPIFSLAQDVPGGKRNGGYVDNIVYDVITQEATAVEALIDGDIDLIGDMIDPGYIEDLQQAENVELHRQLRNGYGYVTINCAKYPFNLTSFRRALAFAVDKYEISNQIWDGESVPQDSCVPQVNPYSVEDELTETYYAEDIDRGKQILEDAGFADDNEDGYLEAPNGDEFDVLVECAQSSDIAIDVGAVIADALTALEIDATSTPTDFYEYLQRLYNHEDYDMVFLGSSFTGMDVDWLAYEYWSEYVDETYYNFPNFANATYDSWRDQLLHNTTLEGVTEAAKEMQKIWVYQAPMIICYENYEYSGYRTDRFEGFQPDAVESTVANYWTNYKVHLKDSEGGPFGGTFTWSNPLDLDTFNFMTSSSAYTMNVLNMFYDSLLTQDWDGEDMPWLATDYVAETSEDNPAVPEGHTRFTFNLVQNATWTDGTPLTAEDVAFSLNYYRDTIGNPYGVDLTEMSAAYAQTPYTVVIEFDTESFWHLHTCAFKPILPKHIFVDRMGTGWQEYNPNPPETPMVTSGPYNVSDYVAGEFCELSYNPLFFYGLDHPEEPTTSPTGPGVNWTLALVAGAVGAAVVILVGGFVLMRQR